jgi:DNA-directed RNA polymerase subunit beta
LNKDTSNSELEAVQHIYRQLRGADAPDDETARGIIDKLFFSDKRYDLGEVGRYKINRKLGSEPAFGSEDADQGRHDRDHQVPGSSDQCQGGNR